MGVSRVGTRIPLPETQESSAKVMPTSRCRPCPMTYRINANEIRAQHPSGVSRNPEPHR